MDASGGGIYTLKQTGTLINMINNHELVIKAVITENTRTKMMTC